MWRRRPKRTQLQPTNRRTSWSGESSTPGLGRQIESELSSVDVNDGLWDDGVCIDYRICLMGCNSLQAAAGVVPLNCELCSPQKGSVAACVKGSFNPVSMTSSAFYKPASCSCKERERLHLRRRDSLRYPPFVRPGVIFLSFLNPLLHNNCKRLFSLVEY